MSTTAPTAGRHGGTPARVGITAGIALAGLLALGGCGHAGPSSHPKPSGSAVSVPLGTGPGAATSRTSQANGAGPSATPTRATTPGAAQTGVPVTGLGGVSLPPGITAAPSPTYVRLQSPAPEVSALADRVAAAMFTFTARDPGPGAWVNASKDALSAGAYAYFASTVGDIPGSAYQFWGQVEDQDGSQSGTVVESEIDPSQAATNTATHVSVSLEVHVSHRGFVYPPGSIDPAGEDQFIAMNLDKTNGRWQITYLASDQNDDLPANYGRLHLTAHGPTGP